MKNSFYSYIGFIFFGGMICLTASDYDVAINSVKPFPGIPIELPLFWLSIIYPIFSIVLFEVHIDSIHRSLRDSRHNSNTEYSWYLSWHPRFHNGRFDALPIFSNFLTWWVFPLFLFLSTIQAIRFHSLWLSYSLIIILVVGLLRVVSRRRLFVVRTNKRSYYDAIIKYFSWCLISAIVIFLSIYVIPKAQKGWPRRVVCAVIPDFIQPYSRPSIEFLRSLFTLELENVDPLRISSNDHGKWNSDFSGRHFEGALFNRCAFVNADFTEASLVGANFSNCNLYGACFKHASLRHCQFTYTNLSRSLFTKADGWMSSFSHTYLDSLFAPLFSACFASFMHCSLINTDFRGSNFYGASIIDVNADQSDFRSFSATEFTLSDDIVYRETSLRSSLLDRSNLKEVRFQGANLFDCDIYMCNLDSANFTGAQLDSSFIISSRFSHASIDESQLRRVESLYWSTFDSTLFGDLLATEPQLFCQPYLPRSRVAYSSDSTFRKRFDTSPCSADKTINVILYESNRK